MSMIQYLKRRADNPFVFKSVSYPDAVLAFSSFQEFSVNRPASVRIGARVFASVEDMNANFEDAMREFTIDLTMSRMVVREVGIQNATIAQKVSDAVNVTMLHSPQGLAIFEYTANAQGGKRFTAEGLAIMLQMPSITGERTLGDEWEIVNP